MKIHEPLKISHSSVTKADVACRNQLSDIVDFKEHAISHMLKRGSVLK